MPFRKKQQFAAGYKIAMHKVIYYIDPLLQVASRVDAALLDAIPDLAGNLPDNEHLALSFETGVEMEQDQRLRFLQLRVPTYSIRSKLQNRSRAFAAWKTPDAKVLVQFSASQWLPVSGIKTLLLTNAADLKTLLATRNISWQAADHILVPYEQDRLTIGLHYPKLADKLEVVYPALEEKTETLGWAGQEQIKLKYSAGRDYCLYIGNLSEEAGLIQLLKAYSLFKKWLLTGMPLVLAGASTEDTPALEKLLTSYKYKADINLHADLEESELKDLVAGAYVLIYPKTTGNDHPIQWAFSAGTPVISVEDLRLREWMGNAAETVPPGDIDLMANAMMVLYKDEAGRSALVEKGRERSGALDRQQTLKRYAAAISGLLGENG